MSDSEAAESSANQSQPEPQPAKERAPNAHPSKEKRAIGLLDLMASGSWYAIPAIWAFFAFALMAIRLGHLLLIAGCVGFVALALVAVGYAAIWEQRHRAMASAERKRAMRDQTRAMSKRLSGPIFSVIWSGFAAGCVAGVFVVIHLNNPFTQEAVDQAVEGNPWLFWGAIAVGAILGVGGRVWSLARPAKLPASEQGGDPGAGFPGRNNG